MTHKPIAVAKPAGKNAEARRTAPETDRTRAPKVVRPDATRPNSRLPSMKASASRTTPAGMQLHTLDGARKYLTARERDLFLKTAERGDRDARTLCMTLAYAGCRLSEALALTADRVDRVDLAAGVLVFESLKKRRAGIYRAVPVPPALLEALDLVHGIREVQAKRRKGQNSVSGPGAG